MIRLYAVLAAPAGPLPEGLSVRRYRGVTVVYDQPAEPPGRDRDEMLRFARVLQGLAATDPVLPVRYGTAVATLEELDALIAGRAARWQRRLAAVADHDELILHVTDPAAPVTDRSAGSGRDHLMAKVHAHRFGRALQQALATALTPYCRELRALGPDRELRVACLVPRDGVREFRAAIERWTAQESGRHTRVTGPWPPFSFTDDPCEECAENTDPEEVATP